MSWNRDWSASSWSSSAWKQGGSSGWNNRDWQQAPRSKFVSPPRSQSSVPGGAIAIASSFSPDWEFYDPTGNFYATSNLRVYVCVCGCVGVGVGAVSSDLGIQSCKESPRIRSLSPEENDTLVRQLLGSLETNSFFCVQALAYDCWTCAVVPEMEVP